jgi:hypothetical protein
MHEQEVGVLSNTIHAGRCNDTPRKMLCRCHSASKTPLASRHLSFAGINCLTESSLRQDLFEVNYGTLWRWLQERIVIRRQVHQMDVDIVIAQEVPWPPPELK